MKRATQNMLYHLLPVVCWLLATGGMVLAHFLIPYGDIWTEIMPPVLVLAALLSIQAIPRHSDSAEPCFRMGVLVAIAAYWLPSAVFLAIPIWIWLYQRNLYSFRSFLATLIGMALVAVWAIVLQQLSIINCHLSLSSHLLAWIPTGITIFAWLLSTILRQTLRVR